MSSARSVTSRSRPELEEGTYEVVGTVISIKGQSSQWGFTEKMLVELDSGQRVYGTLPSAIAEAQKGDRVAFTATVTRSPSDPIFGFFSRPRKARIET
jgi:hypothetical protein